MIELHAPERWQAEMIERAVAIATADKRIRGAWLGGSFGSGEQDAFSDVDLHYLVDGTSAPWFGEHWRETAASVAGAPLALASGIPGVIGGYVLTDRFRHLDLVVHALDDERRIEGQSLYHGNPSHVLYDPDELLPSPPQRDGLGHRSAYFPAGKVTFFFYMLHAFAVCMGRRETVLCCDGVLAIRALLVEVMLGENGVEKRGGNKRLNPYLTDEQRRFLERTPAASGTEPASIIGAVGYLSREFIRRGRRLAERTGDPWPTELESAAMTHLQETLRVDSKTFL